MISYAGVTGEKNTSWICCNKESKSHVNFMPALDKFANRKDIKEYEIHEIIENKVFIFKTRLEYKKDMFYNIAFKVNADNTISPLFLTPYPCKKQNACNNIVKAMNE